MKKIILMLAGAALVVSVGCKSEVDGKTAAKVEESTTETAGNAEAGGDKGEEPASADAKSTASFDKEASKIEWLGEKVTRSHDGGFKEFDGTVTYGADGKIEAVQVEIDTSSIWSDTEKLTGHLKNPDFFDVAKFPKATFKSTKIEAGGDEGTHTVTGDLEMVGVKKQLTFPVTIKKAGSTFVTTSEFTLQRFDWGIEYPGMADDLIKKSVLVKLNIVTPVPAES